MINVLSRGEFLTSLDKILSISMLSSGFTVASFIDKNCNGEQRDIYYVTTPRDSKTMSEGALDCLIFP